MYNYTTLPSYTFYMKYKIDIAHAGDTEALTQFQLAMAAESENTKLDYETVREGIKAVIADDSRGTYLVARNTADTPLGMLLLTTEWSDWHNASYYWVQSAYVRPDSRGQGVFSELFDMARLIAQSEGNGSLRLYVDQNNATARYMYEHLGMRQSHYLMYEI